DFVGAVDGDVQPAMMREIGDDQAAVAGLPGTAFGRRDGDDVQPIPHAADQRGDRKACGGAGAQPDRHAVLDQFHGRFGSGTLQGILIHQARAARNTRSQLPAQTLATSSSVMPLSRNAAAISWWREKSGSSAFAAPAGRSVPMPTWSMPTASISRNKWRIMPGSFSCHRTAIHAPITPSVSTTMRA